jgi:alpha-L-fucosidase
MKSKIVIVAALLALIEVVAGAAESNAPAIIPAPQKLETRAGAFSVTRTTRIVTDAASRETAALLAAPMRVSTGFPLPIETAGSGEAPKGAIVLTTQGAKSSLGAEGYELTVSPDAVVMRAPDQAGLLYGAQTLLQLLPPEIFATAATTATWSVPAVQIEDQPRFKWRGFMLDVSRHFFTKDDVKRTLDLMALHKLNTFHWHLVDDHGWRIEIKKYPKLTEVGAWRAGVGFQFDASVTKSYDATGRYGGFYTQDDVREIVAYAATRHITVVPEIEMPGHATAALAAYPQYSCTGGPFTPELKGGVFNGVYCAGNDEAFTFLQDVLSEIIPLFPGKYVHIGGDEAPKDNWKKCPKCQARMKAEDLKTEHELQSYFIRRIEKFINSRGKNLIGWTEIREGGLAQNAALMDWTGGAVESATEGHDVVMSPTGFCYFDHAQSRNQRAEPRAFPNSFLPLEKVYTFEPIPSKLPAQFANHILGGQANLWTEYVPNFKQVEYMMYPRLCALAETVWSSKESRNFEDFSRRLQVHEQRLDQLAVNYRHTPATNQSASVQPPAPYGPVPSARQLKWHELEFYGFLHFTVNTFTDKEWGYGDESESVFNPTAFDADQILRTAAAAGMKGLILTAKHHDGFCLWPSQYTEHSVKKSPWRNGQGDVVKEISEACRKQGLKFGVYLSPWDRNFKDYGKPEYITYYRNQLRELLSNYGPLFEVWFDGANGGDGYYGGAKEKRTIDRKMYYDWANTWQIVRELQPDACMFSDGGPDVRWVGNENGRAGETCWATLRAEDFAPGQANQQRLNRGDRPGSQWIPAECDVSIRPGWFYHTNEDARVKTAKQLVDLYYASVGRGSSLLLNLPPDRRGQIPDQDIASLTEFRRQLDATFTQDFARSAKATASANRGSDARFAAANAFDGKNDTYWAPDDSATNAELVAEFSQPVTFNVVRLRELLPLGQRVEAFALDQWQEGQWAEFATGTSIGNCRLVRQQQPITTTKVRLRIVNAPVCPAIAEFSLFAEKS